MVAVVAVVAVAAVATLVNTTMHTKPTALVSKAPSRQAGVEGGVVERLHLLPQLLVANRSTPAQHPHRVSV